MEKPAKIIVHMSDPESAAWRKVGALVFDKSRGLAAFMYDKKYQGPPIDPKNLNPADNPSGIFQFPIDGPLPGVFMDHMPGDVAMEYLAKLYPEVAAARSPIETLYHLGCYEHSALMFANEDYPTDEYAPYPMEKINAYVEKLGIDKPEVPQFSDKQIMRIRSELGATLKRDLGGPKPHVVARVKNAETGRQEDWFVKFNHGNDSPFRQADDNRLEHTVKLVSDRAMIETPEQKLIELDNQSTALASQRYDEYVVTDPQNDALVLRQQPLHRLSFATMLNKPPGEVTFTDMVQVVENHSSSPERDKEQLCRQMVMDLLTNNTNNHGRNYEMRLDDVGYALAPSFGKSVDASPNNKFGSSFLYYGQGADVMDTLFQDQVADVYGMEKTAVGNIVDDCRTAIVEHFPGAAAEAGLSAKEKEHFLAAVSTKNPDIASEMKTRLASHERAETRSAQRAATAPDQDGPSR